MKFHISFAHIVVMANSLLSSVIYVIRSARYIEPAVALRDHSRNWISARSPLMSLSLALGTRNVYSQSHMQVKNLWN